MSWFAFGFSMTLARLLPHSAGSTPRGATRGRCRLVQTVSKKFNNWRNQMKIGRHQLLLTTSIATSLAMARLASAANFTWSGPSGGDWTNSSNWSPSGPPGTNDEARFFNPGAVADATIDNVVSTNMTIQRLWVGQTNNIHNMAINSGVTLTIAGTNDNGWGALGSDPNSTSPDPLQFLSPLYVGTTTTNSSTQIAKATVSRNGTR